MDKSSIIFVCTGNSCRSQMAEGWMKKLAGDRFEVYSAGSRPASFIHPLAVKAMEEAGVDIRMQHSKGVDSFGTRKFDYVVTVCDSAEADCPTMSGRKATLHWSINDPSDVLGGEAARMTAARQVRDELKIQLEALVQKVQGVNSH